MPKGNGKGGGGNGGTPFAITGTDASGDHLLGTGDPVLDGSGVPTRVIIVTITDGTTSWTGPAEWYQDTDGTWLWRFELSTAVNPGDPADTFDEWGDFTATASYTEIHPKNGKEKTTETEPFALSVANSPPTIGGEDTGSLTEDDPSVGGALTITDPNPGESAFQAETIAGLYGSFGILADGSWTYTPGAAAQALNAGDIETKIFTVTSADGSTTHDVTITLNGVNDGAIIGGTAVGVLGEDDAAPAGGALTVSDSDDGEAIFVVQSGTPGSYGSFDLLADGTWSYTLDGRAQALNAGDVEVESFTVTTLDGTSATVDVTVTGANDAAVIGGTAVGALGEDDAAPAGGALTVSDPDDGEAGFVAQSGTPGSYGSFDLLADGSWSYTLDGRAQALNAGDVEVESFTVTTLDGTSATVDVTVTGANDAAVISGTLAGSVSEDGTLNTGGTVSVSDADDGESGTVAQSNVTGSYGTFSIDAAGAWTYALDNESAAVQALGSADTVFDSFAIQSTDGTPETVVVTITGADEPANQAPVANDDDRTTAEDTPVSFNIFDNDSDPDGDAFFVWETFPGTGDGSFSIDPLTGAVTFTPDPDFNGTASFSYTLSDGTLVSAPATVTVTVTAVEDPPVAVEDTPTVEYQTATVIDVIANDYDPDGDTISVVAVGLAANGSVSLGAGGVVTYTPNAGYDGPDSFTYTLEDANGNQSVGTVNVTVNPEVDTTPPPPPTLDLADASDSGKSQTDDITNDNTPTLVGTGEVGATIELFDGGASLGTTTVDAGGTWEMTVTLGEGAHALTAVATDAANNSSAPSSVLQVTIDTGTDTPVVTGVEEADGTDSADNITDDTTPVIKGTAEAGADVTVRVNGAVVGVVIADAAGLWEIELTDPLAAGSHDVTASAVDVAGNASPVSATYQMEVAPAPPPPPDPPPTGDSYTPDDPLYGDQWHLTRIGDLERIWSEFSGQGVLVGIYDNGVEETHEDLGNYDLAHELTTDPGSQEHGTAVAGIIGGSDNSVGVIGIAFNATMGGANIFSGSADINNNPSGYEAVIDQADLFDVISLSWGNAPDWSHQNQASNVATYDAFAAISANGRGGKGTIIVKAAGNDTGNANADYINTQRYAIVVNAHDSGDESGSPNPDLPDVAYYSNRGSNVLVSAPSSGNIPSGNLGVMTTDLTGSGGYSPTSYTGTGSAGFGGTSSATPVVTGVVSLMLEANPALGWRDVQEILAYSAEKMEGTPGAFDAQVDVLKEFLLGIIPIYETRDVAGTFFDWFENDAYNANGGGLHFSEDYGFGRVDVFNAVRMAEVWSMFWEVDVAPTDPGAVETSQNEMFVGTGAVPVSLSAFGQPIEIDWTYTGAPMLVEHVEVFLWWSADQRENISIDLVAPSGTEVSLLQGDGNTSGVADVSTNTGIGVGGGSMFWKFAAKNFMNEVIGEDPNDSWTIRVTDLETGGVFDNLAVSQWAIQLYGEAADPALSRNDAYHYTQEMIDLGYYLDPTRVELSDPGGTDWLNFAAMTSDLLVNLQPGASSFTDPGLSQIEIVDLDGAAAATTTIENAIGGDGNDQLVGNDTANQLAGMRGNDTLEGGAGADDLFGFHGDDELWGGADADAFFFEPGHGDDWIGDFSQLEFDYVSLNGFLDVSTFDDLDFTTVGTDQVLNFTTGDSITFANASSLTFTENDFSINGPGLFA